MTRINWAYEEIVLAADLVARHGWRGLDDPDPRVIALSQLLNRAALHRLPDRDPNFRSPSSVARKTWDIASRHPGYSGAPTKGSHLDRTVMRAFLTDPERMAVEARAIAEALDEGVSPLPETSLEEMEAFEGQILLARHIRRERDSKLRASKIRAVRAMGRRPVCEVCAFDFEASYGSRGSGYIEVHHVLPLHVSGSVRTRLADLALLCSNCHRMMHRPPWTTPDNLREMLGATGSAARAATRELSDS